MKNYIVPNEVRLNSFPFSFWNNSFLKPSDRLPALEFNHDFIGVDALHEIEEDMAINSVSSEVKWLVYLNETTRHL